MKTNTIARTTITSIVILFLSVAAATNVAAQVAGKFQSKAFASPGEAADALLSAASTFDTTALRDILGPDSYDVIHSGEPALDKQTAMEFAALGAAKKTTTFDPKSKARAFLLVGDDDWPFPIPIVKQAGKWYFDTRAGRKEILYRRIGRNELSAIQAARGYVEAQQEYSLTKHDGALVNQFAQRLVSSPGKQDGLAWQNSDGTWGGTVGEQAAKELQNSYTGERTPYHGYYFKILKGQGPAAQLGEMDFMVKGAMIGGFALLAVPAIYEVTGVKSFMVSHEGIVYEKDLGPGGLEAAKSIERYNPDRTWSVVKDDE